MNLLMNATVAMITMFAASTAFADVCNAALENNDLLGDYTLTMGPGRMTAVVRNGTREHIVPETTGTVTIYEDDEGLVVFSDDIVAGARLEIVLRPAAANDRDYYFSENTTYSPISSDDVANAVGCDDTRELSQHVGDGSISGNGVVIANSIRLFVYLT